MWCIIPTIKNPLHTLHRKHNFQCIHPYFTQTVPRLKRRDTYNLPKRQCARVQHTPYTSLNTAAIAHKLQMIPLTGQLQSVCDSTCSLAWGQTVTARDPTPCISQCPLQPQHRPAAALYSLDIHNILHKILPMDEWKRSSYMGKVQIWIRFSILIPSNS